MRATLNTVFLWGYTLFMVLFLVTALVLVLGQVAGLVFVQPGLIQGTKDALLQPAIIAAVLAGLFGFAVYNAEGAKPEGD